jgi:hypothetical protein
VTAYLSALAVCAASVAVGAALCCKERDWSWTAPAVGLAAIVLLALGAVRLPGHGATAAVTLALATAVSVAVVARRRVALLPLLEGLPVAAIVLALCSLPFIANQRMGELGGYVLDDLSFHMAQADALRTLGAAAHVTPADYPNGPHAVVAALESGFGIGPSAPFTGLLIAAPVLTALTALAALDGARWYLRIPAASLVGVPYLAASYFAEGAFKEPLLALFVLGFVLTLRDWRHSEEPRRRHAVALVLTAAGAVAVFGVTALAWPAAVLAWFAVLELANERLHLDLRRWRPQRNVAIATAAAGLAVAVALAVSASAFFDSGPGRHLTTKSAGGNFFGQLSPLEALGVWRQPDFRIALSNQLFRPGVLLACAVVAFGLVWCWRRRDWALLAGTLGAVSVYAVARPFAAAYFNGKALVVLAPLLTLVALKALATLGSERAPAGRRLVPLAAAALLALYVVVGGASSALALRGARVRPSDRGQDLAAFRHVVSGQPTLYFGRDNFAPWELRGARLRGFQPYDTPLGTGVPEEPSKSKADAYLPAVDVDSVDPAFLDSLRYLIMPRTAYASQMPGNLRPLARTRWHVLWERTSGTLPRHHLAEGEAPGKVLDCNTASGRELARQAGVAYIRPPPVVPGRGLWRTATGELPPGGIPWEALNGEARTQVLRLPPGTWDISLRWFSDVPLRVRAGALRTTLPAYTADETTFASAGQVHSEGGPLTVRVNVPARRRLATLRTVRLGTVAATRVDERGRLVPLARACGKYVDWYRLRGE